MYKVINQCLDEINRYLEVKLLPQIKKAFSTYQSVASEILQNELKQEMRQAEDLGVDPEYQRKAINILYCSIEQITKH
jgi:transcription initiation factor TFIIIB Brf1 subunit/transcription initiation factor TFIIB